MELRVLGAANRMLIVVHEKKNMINLRAIYYFCHTYLTLQTNIWYILFYFMDITQRHYFGQICTFTNRK